VVVCGGGAGVGGAGGAGGAGGGAEGARGRSWDTAAAACTQTAPSLDPHLGKQSKQVQ
jgi:hypothetical protein